MMRRRIDHSVTVLATSSTGALVHASPEHAERMPVSRLRAAVRGEIIEPADPAYDGARTVYFSGFDRRPAAIVRPVDAADVARVVDFARYTGIELAVRSGGHSAAGHGVSDGGVVLDLSAMRTLDIDVAARTAWAETGLTAGEYTRELGAHGLATGFGDAAGVGIGGITLGGGVGFLHRRHGMTIDNLLAAEVVTADGELVRTDADTHPDLFWAIRGGGGNFGVVTRFQYRLREVDTVVGGMLILPATPAVIATVVAEADAAPEQLSGMINITIAPPMPFLPAEVRGKPIVMALLVYDGNGDAAERAFAPFRAVAAPLMDGIRTMRYPEVYDGPEPPHPVAFAIRNGFVDSVDVAAGEAILDALQRSTAPMSVVQFRPLGGAVARVPADATAFVHRDRRLMTNIAAMVEHVDAVPQHALWVNGVAGTLQQGQPGAYIGFLAAEGEARVREAYRGATWDRLREIKRRYDPSNLFRLNQNIPPAEV
jgi:FAD/FMN-containing dehydrogenase